MEKISVILAVKREAIKMLCQFSFRILSHIEMKLFLDLQATAIPEFKDNLIVKDKCSDLLPVSVIYGPNWRRKDEFDPSVILSYYNSGETDS
mgnify:CR=1 FL=1